MKTIYHKPEGIEASGPYTPAVEIQTGETRTLYVSGQGTRDPKTGQKFLGDIGTQTKLALDNLRIVIESCNFSMSEVVKVTLYLIDMNDFPKVNEVYKEFFIEGHYPARSTVAVKNLPGGQAIEIDAIAIKELL